MQYRYTYKYFSTISVYDDWNENPILTSVKTTGLPIKNIQYPTIIICGQGSNKHVPESALLQHIIEFGNIKGKVIRIH